MGSTNQARRRSNFMDQWNQANCPSRSYRWPVVNGPHRLPWIQKRTEDASETTNPRGAIPPGVLLFGFGPVPYVGGPCCAVPSSDLFNQRAPSFFHPWPWAAYSASIQSITADCSSSARLGMSYPRSRSVCASGEQKRHVWPVIQRTSASVGSMVRFPGIRGRGRSCVCVVGGFMAVFLLQPIRIRTCLRPWRTLRDLFHQGSRGRRSETRPECRV